VTTIIVRFADQVGPPAYKTLLYCTVLHTHCSIIVKSTTVWGGHGESGAAIRDHYRRAPSGPGGYSSPTQTPHVLYSTFVECHNLEHHCASMLHPFVLFICFGGCSVSAEREPFPLPPHGLPHYVWHCHVSEHEDNDMMKPLSVTHIPSLFFSFGACLACAERETFPLPPNSLPPLRMALPRVRARGQTT